MNKSKIIFTIFIAILILLTTNINVSASSKVMNFNTNNKQIYLGSASITGNGNSSILEAIADNDLLIKIDSITELVDFYIDYNMDCNGLFDEGTITLSILLNGENSSGLCQEIQI